ncbi:penicillin acylase family protein [Streptomyces sp. NPDC050523]|uniref:penicillin acylase family protein n=1 Tax=Streptomyces sp. NPDC050523 TaxID=3365622 RepID=UPI00379269BB
MPALKGGSHEWTRRTDKASETSTERPVAHHRQSANPASPHYSDQTRLFSRKRWVTERFTEAEINGDPAVRTTTLRS